MVPVGLKTEVLVTNSPIRKKFYGSGMTTLIILNNKMKNIMKIVKSLKESRLLIIGVSEAIENEAKEQKRGFFSMLLCTLGAMIL